MSRNPLLHYCEPGYDVENERPRFECAGFGAAITACHEDEDGALWCGNDEYGTRVNFCPFCGYKARLQINIAAP